MVWAGAPVTLMTTFRLVYAAGDVLAVRAENAADNELADAHADGAVDQERTTAGLVDEEEDGSAGLGVKDESRAEE